MNAGDSQEGRLVQYLRERGFPDIAHDRMENIRKLLGLPLAPGCKCADVIAFGPNRAKAQRIVVAESKGTDIDKALLQLGNAAAAVLEKHGKFKTLELLIYIPSLKRLRDGRLSPGPGYAQYTTLTPKLYRLLRATSSNTWASARCELGYPWSRWNAIITGIPVHTYVEEAPQTVTGGQPGTSGGSHK